LATQHTNRGLEQTPYSSFKKYFLVYLLLAI
jgi:hypothetical protein